MKPAVDFAGADCARYLVRRRPYEDLCAVNNIRNQGFDCFAPLCVIERVHKRRFMKWIEALFPSYAFVALNCIDHDWTKLRFTRGVSHLVRFGTFAPTVPREVIQRLRAADGVELSPMARSLGPGDCVRILNGRFVDLEAIFETHDGTERVRVHIDLMHWRLSMPVPAKTLIAA